MKNANLKYLLWIVLFLSLVLVACRSNTQANKSTTTTTPRTSSPTAAAPTPSSSTASKPNTSNTPGPTTTTPTAPTLKDTPEALAADATITFDYTPDATAWLVKDVQGAQGVAELNSKNPTLTFEVGKRYAFNSPQSQVHPFALRDAEHHDLIAQGPTKGSLETNSDINFVDKGNSFAFTMTEELAKAVKTYNCTTHPPMVGNVEISHGG